MNRRNQIKYDKYDIKVLKELPIIIEAIASTGNKIAQMLDPLYEELLSDLRKRTGQKRNWTVEKENKMFLPLTSQEYSSMTKIQSLHEHFELNYSLRLTKRLRQKKVNEIWIEMGYIYQKGESNSPFFTIYHENVDKYGGTLAKMEYYKALTKKLKKVDIEHPSEGHEYECIFLYCDTTDFNQSVRTFHLFKNTIVPAFIKNAR